MNEIISIANNILKCHVSGCVFGISSRKEKRGLFLMAGAEFLRKFYFSVCKLLRAGAIAQLIIQRYIAPTWEGR